VTIRAYVLRFTFYVLSLVPLLLLTGCASEPALPPLAVPGQPTLVFIYTDG